jgi:hypothetical protein
MCHTQYYVNFCNIARGDSAAQVCCGTSLRSTDWQVIAERLG